MKDEFALLRERMIQDQLIKRGISDQRVLWAMGRVPREEFVPQEFKDQAYQDGPLPIGYGQTISQPYVIALAIELLELKGDEKVLDIGTGSGYEAAILSLLARKVISIERIPQLAKEAGERLKRLGYDNVEVVVGDGSRGLKKEAPFDAVKSAAASRRVPRAWKEQLKDGGRIVLPLRRGFGQDLVRVIKKGDRFIQQSYGGVRYVPLISD